MENGCCVSKSSVCNVKTESSDDSRSEIQKLASVIREVAFASSSLEQKIDEKENEYFGLKTENSLEENSEGLFPYMTNLLYIVRNRIWDATKYVAKV